MTVPDQCTAIRSDVCSTPPIDFLASAVSTEKSAIKHDAVIATPWFGISLGMRFSGARLVELDFLAGASDLYPPGQQEQLKTANQLEQYFSAPEIDFDMELELHGTPYQQRVWQALREIPAGQTLDYTELAQRLNSSARAVGNACRANPLPIVVPCHRVVAKSGLGGYMGQREGEAVDIKRWLLQHEHSRNGKV